MKTYPTKKLGEVCEIFNGVSVPKAEMKSAGKFKILKNRDYNENEIFWGNDENGWTDKDVPEKKLLKVGDSLLINAAHNKSHVASKVGYVTEVKYPKTVTSGEVMVIRAKEEIILPKIIHFLLKNREFIDQLKSLVDGIHLYPKDVVNIEIPIPPLSEQRKIVARLERMLAKIGEAKKLRAEARENADNLLSAELHKIFSQQDSYSLIRANKRIVKKWEEKELEEICEINPKKSELKNEPDDLPVSFVPMKAIDEFSQEITSFDEKKLEEVRKGYTYFRDGDVLFAKITPCMENGKVAIARNLKNSIGFGTTEFHVIRPREGVLPEWIYAIIRHPEFRDVAKTKMTGSAGQKRVPVQFLENFKIPLPPIDEQKKIVARLDSLSEKIEKIKKLQSQTAADFKTLEQSILHQAFSNYQ